MELPDAQAPELVHRIKAIAAETPVVLLSSNKRIDSVDAPVDLLLRKGHAPAELLDRIRLLLAKRRGPRRAATAPNIHDKRPA
jgi:DNA-binding response OmpR family regulator